jgi:hypothetical protein
MIVVTKYNRLHDQVSQKRYVFFVQTGIDCSHVSSH